MRHHTTDPAVRASHIADRMAKEHEQRQAEMGVMPYTGWPGYWLDAYDQVIQELQPLPETNHEMPS